MLAHDLNCVIFNVCVFAFPAFSAIARKIMTGVPCAVHSPGGPSYPGLGGLNAAVKLIDKYENNHVHGVPGNYLNELEKFCRLTGIEFLLIT